MRYPRGLFPAFLLLASATAANAETLAERAETAARSIAQDILEAHSENLASVRFALNSDLSVTTAAIWDDRDELAFPDLVHEHIRLELSKPQTEALFGLMREPGARWHRTALKRDHLVYCQSADNICLLLDQAAFSTALGVSSDALEASLFGPGRGSGAARSFLFPLALSIGVVALAALVLRRRRPAAPAAGAPTDPDSFRVADIEISPARLTAMRNGVETPLSRRDVVILKHLQDRRGAVVSKDELYDAAWGRDYMPNSRALEQHIRSLRRKLDPDQSQPAIIETVHGAG